MSQAGVVAEVDHHHTKHRIALPGMDDDEGAVDEGAVDGEAAAVHDTRDAQTDAQSARKRQPDNMPPGGGAGGAAAWGDVESRGNDEVPGPSDDRSDEGALLIPASTTRQSFVEQAEQAGSCPPPWSKWAPTRTTSSTPTRRQRADRPCVTVQRMCTARREAACSSCCACLTFASTLTAVRASSHHAHLGTHTNTRLASPVKSMPWMVGTLAAAHWLTSLALAQARCPPR